MMLGLHPLRIIVYIHTAQQTVTQMLYTVKTFGLLQPNFSHLNCMSVVYMTQNLTTI